MTEQLVLIAILILFVPFWCLISYGVAKAGWNKLAKKYPARNTQPRETHYFSSVILNQYANYNVCVAIGFTDIGVYLKVMAIFPFHEPILIPYEELHATGEAYSFMFQTYTIGQPVAAQIAFGPFISQHLQQKLLAR